MSVFFRLWRTVIFFLHWDWRDGKRRRSRVDLSARRNDSIESLFQLRDSLLQCRQDVVGFFRQCIVRVCLNETINSLLQLLISLLQLADLLEARRDDLQAILEQLNAALQVVNLLRLPLLHHRQVRPNLVQRHLISLHGVFVLLYQRRLRLRANCLLVISLLQTTHSTHQLGDTLRCQKARSESPGR